jgi:lambda family phage tail tape measure protein
VGVKRELDTELKQAIQDREEYMRGEGFRSDTLEVQQETLAAYTANESALNRQISLLDNQRELATVTKVQVVAQQNGWTKIAAEAGTAAEVAKVQLNTAAASLDATTRLSKQETDRKNNLDTQLAVMKLQNIQLERDTHLTKLAGETELALLDIQKQELQLQLDKGTLSVDSYNQQVAALEKVERVKQRDIKLSELQKKLTADSVVLGSELAAATAAQIPEILAKIKANSDLYNAEVNGIQAVFNATEKLKDQQGNLSQRQAAYADLFTQAFKSMEDAIVEFAKTGKLSFSSMIDSFIEGLIRYELQQQQAMMFQSMGGARGLAQLFIGQVSGVGREGSNSFVGPLQNPPPLKLAKGGAFDYGIEAFAKGGMFTNSIVDSPTLFKFAKGTGLMGEAGPEAIMPLTRDSSGNLGVRAQNTGSNVEVVVNNYSTAQAETRETVDSRGNRRIEVVVGDMTAGEISRNGSASQKAIRGTFGLQPQLIRR